MDLRVSKAVEEVIVLGHDDRGRRTARTVYRRSKKRTRTKGPLGTLDRVVRTLAAGQKAAADTYLERHNKSNKEKEDGWLHDLSYNVYRATRVGLKRVRKGANLPSIEIE